MARLPWAPHIINRRCVSRLENFINIFNRTRHLCGRRSCGGGAQIERKHLPVESFELCRQREILVEKVGKTIRSRPRWEGSLLSDFPSLDLSDSDLVYAILKRETNPVISFRFFQWASSQHGFCPEARCFNAMLESLVKAKAWKIAMTLLCSMKCLPNPTLLDSFISGVCLEGRIDEALDVLSYMKELEFPVTVRIWNSVLLGALSIGRTYLVSQLYGEMIGSGVVGDIETVGYLIQAFCKENRVAEAYELLREVRANGYVPDTATFSSLISGFCHKADYDRVSELLHLMIANNRMPDVFTYQEIIHGLCKNSRELEAFRIFNDIKDRGYAPDAVTYTTMIEGLCKIGEMVDAKKLWLEMCLKGFGPNEYAYNIFICAYCRMGNLAAAWKVFIEMTSKGYQDIRSYSILMSELCAWGRINEARHLFAALLKRGIIQDLIMYNTLIKGFCTQGEIHEAMYLHNDLVAAGLRPTHSSYAPLVRVVCKKGNVGDVMKLMDDMCEHDLMPSARTFDYVISRLCAQGNASEGMVYLMKALQARIRPRKRTFTRLIECLTLKDRIHDALVVLGARLEMNYMLGKTLWGLLVGELCKGNLERTRTTLDTVLQANGCTSVVH